MKALMQIGYGSLSKSLQIQEVEIPFIKSITPIHKPYTFELNGKVEKTS